MYVLSTGLVWQSENNTGNLIFSFNIVRVVQQALWSAELSHWPGFKIIFLF